MEHDAMMQLEESNNKKMENETIDEMRTRISTGKDLANIILAHTNYPTKTHKAYRGWDKKTPYWIHPVWCATTILTETKLEEKTRLEGYLALLYHDVLEDTTFPLPEDLPLRIKQLVQEMTFPNGNKQEMQEIWTKPQEVKLYKLYDKVNNLLDGSWMDAEKRKRYENYTGKLYEDVINNYGKLNITSIANGIILKENIMESS